MAGGQKAANWELAAVALATGKTVGEAAVAAGVAERTVFRWNIDPAFSGRVSELRREILGRACGTLAEATTAAANKLRALVDSTTEIVALRAASAVLEHALKVVELVELQHRVEQLEQMLVRAESGSQGERPSDSPERVACRRPVPEPKEQPFPSD